MGEVLKAIGEEGVIVRVLRCLVQSILFVGCYYVSQVTKREEGGGDVCGSLNMM